MTIRDATPKDAAVIAAIYNESIAAGDSTMDESLKTAEDIRSQMVDFSNREAYLLLEADGVVQGWGIIKRYSDRAGYRFCCETSVYIRRDRGGRGYGTRLQQALMARCQTLGYHHIVVKIWATNTVSIRLHEQCGFDIVGTQREIGYRQGRWQDVVIMQCVLPEPSKEI